MGPIISKQSNSLEIRLLFSVNKGHKINKIDKTNKSHESLFDMSDIHRKKGNKLNSFGISVNHSELLKEEQKIEILTKDRRSKPFYEFSEIDKNFLASEEQLKEKESYTLKKIIMFQ